MPIFSVNGVPGIGTTITATPNTFLYNTAGLEYLEGGRVIDGVNAGDWTNPTISTVLTSGIVLGKIASSGKYAPTILGVLSAALGGNQTTLNIGAAAATELARRVGSSGTFNLVGAPASGGVVRSRPVTFSAVNTTTGAVTISADLSGAVSGVNQVNSIPFVDSTGSGTFTVTVEGITTAAITYSATAATLATNIATAINAALGTSAVTVSNGSLATIAITFSGTGYTNRPIGAVTATILTGSTGYTVNGSGTIGTPSTCAVTTAGVVAVAADEGEYVSGSYISATDGSGAPLVFLEDLYGCQVTNGFGTRQDTQAPRLVVAGHIISANVPAYSSLSAEAKTYLKAQLNSNGRHFVFDDEY